MDALLPPAATQSSGDISAKAARLLNGDKVSEANSTHGSIKKAAEDFEAAFLNQMLGSMFEGISTEAPFGGGYGEKVFRSMMVTEYANDIVRSGGIGVSDAVAQELLAQQEGRDK